MVLAVSCILMFLECWDVESVGNKPLNYFSNPSFTQTLVRLMLNQHIVLRARSFITYPQEIQTLENAAVIKFSII